MGPLLRIEQMPDVAEVHVYISSRGLNRREQANLRSVTDGWLHDWLVAYPKCTAAESRVILRGRVLVWAIDSSPRQADGVPEGLTGIDLDLLFRRLEAFSSQASPPLSVEPGIGLIVDGAVVSLSPSVVDLAAEGRVTPETLVFYNCSVEDWRKGRFLHRLGDDTELAAAIIDHHSL